MRWWLNGARSQSPNGRRERLALLSAILALALLGFVGPASAATVPFNPAQPTVFIAQGSPTQLDKATQSGGAITFTPVGGTVAGLTYNAIGYDTCNNFIYGVQTSATATQSVGAIIQVASDGSITYPGINVGAADNAGAFGPPDATCDNFYVGASGGTTMTEVNVLAPTAKPATVSVGGAILGPDFTYANGYFWAMGNPSGTGSAAQSQIQRIAIPGLGGTAPTATFTVSTPAVGITAPTGSYGAAWTYGNGDVGFSNNNSGNIYEIRITNPGSSSPTFTTVISQSGPASSNNDGTNAPGLNTDLAVTKTASPAMVDPGGKITFTLTVTNNGPGNSSGYVLSDTLPSGLTSVATASTGCTVSSPTAVVCAGAPLAAGASVTDTITANAPKPFTAPITNSATVTANEADPNASNNTATATVSPNIVTVSMVKSAVVTPASDQNAANVGDTITYSYNVTNTGNVPLTSVGVSDPSAGVAGVACPTPAPPGLAPGATETCTARTPFVVTQINVDAGSVSDTATATGTDATGFPSPASASSTTIKTVAAAPSLILQKVADESLGNSAPIQAGETIQYSYVVTNTGNVDLTSLSVSDPTAGAVSCPVLAARGLAPGDTETCTANVPYVVTQTNVDQGGVTDTATATGTDLQGDSATSPPSTVSTSSLPNPAVSVDKRATVTPTSDQTAVKVGDTIQYSYVVTNIGNVSLASVAVSDPVAGTVTCPIPAAPGLAPGQTETCTADHPYTVTQADVDNGAVTDTATATGTDTHGNTSAPSNPSTATVLAVLGDPSVSIAKAATVSPSADQTAVKAGDTIQYSYKVTNTGNTTLTSVAVNDPTAGNVTCPTPADPGLAPGASETCTADSPYTVTQSDVDAGGVTDSATATGVDTQGAQSDPSAASKVTVPAVAAAPSVSLTKNATVDPSTDQNAVQVGDRISYSYTVTNTGNVTLTSVAVSDPSAGNVTCPTPAAPGLGPGKPETCIADNPHVVTQADVDNGGVTDAATATGTDTLGGQSPSSSPARHTVPATPATPLVSIQKFANAANGDTNPITTGEQIQYSYLVTNTGNVDLTTLSVSDNKVSSVNCPTPAPPGLPPGDFETCTGTYTASATDAADNNVTNTATATGSDAAGATSPNSAPVTISIPEGTPAPAVEIHKSASVTPSSDSDGVVVGDAISYSYIVTNTGNVNLSSVAVNDPTAGSVTCPTLTAPGLAPGASVTCTQDIAYLVTQSDVDAGGVTDVATATGTATVAGSPVTSPTSPSDSITIPAGTNPAVSIVKSATVTPAADQTGVKPGDTIQYSYLVTNIGNTTLNTISVTDSNGISVSCPAPAPSGLAPGSAETCTADHAYTVTQADVDAGAVNDTATASGVDLLAEQSPNASGSLTVPAEPADPELSLAKHGTVTPAADQDDIKVGDTINYSYVVTNTGDVTLTSFGVIDPTLGPVTCPTPAPPGLAPGASATCTADNPYTVVQADIDNGGASDEATATGGDANGNSTSTAIGRDTDAAVRSPRVSLVKTATVVPAAEQNDARVGDVIAYSFRVTNIGNVDLTSVAVSDPSLGAVSCPIPAPPGLAPGDSEICTGEIQHVVSLGDQASGSVTNTATATGTDSAADTSPASSPSTDSVPVQQPPKSSSPAPPAPVPSAQVATKLLLSKHVNKAHAYPGQRLTYTLKVTNAGPDTATDVKITDTPTIALKIISVHAGEGHCQAGPAITCTLGTLDVGKTVKVQIVAEVKGTGVERNTAVATSAVKLLDPQDATSTATTKVTPILRVHKTASVPRATTGENVTYKITVTNLTIIAIDRIAVCDALPSGLLYVRSTPGANVGTGQPCWKIARLAAGRSKHFIVVANVAPGYSGKLVNHATARGPGIPAVRATAPVTVTRAPQLPCASASGLAAGGHGHPVARAAC